MDSIAFLEKLAVTAYSSEDVEGFLKNQPEVIRQAFSERDVKKLQRQISSQQNFADANKVLLYSFPDANRVVLG